MRLATGNTWWGNWALNANRSASLTRSPRRLDVGDAVVMRCSRGRSQFRVFESSSSSWSWSSRSCVLFGRPKEGLYGLHKHGEGDFAGGVCARREADNQLEMLSLATGGRLGMLEMPDQSTWLYIYIGVATVASSKPLVWLPARIFSTKEQGTRAVTDYPTTSQSLGMVTMSCFVPETQRCVLSHSRSAF
ncbi:unnamed protein product [Diplocarpon coronariae]|nr:hypothetical protein JHW43_005864 [Diplocarpon mali]